MKRLIYFVSILLLLGLFNCTGGQKEQKVLVFTKTEGFRHSSIPDGIALIRRLGEQHGFTVDTTENAKRFNEENLQQYAAVIFLSTTGDVLDQYQEADFERYIQAGGGFVGIHAAADTEYNWPWYGKLVGAYFQSHPAGTPKATIDVVDHNHPSTDSLPDRWERTDEWYNYYNINPDVNVLATLDESTYEGGENGEFHPTAWYHEYDGGRAFYTGGGHTSEAFSEPLFVKHVWGGLQWVLEESRELDYSKATSFRVPEENRFTITVLDQFLYEPTELVVLDDFRVLFIERRGTVKLYNPKEDSTRVINKLDLYTGQEDGLMGLAVDPDFNQNHWVYLYYSPAGEEPKQHLSRFKFTGSALDLESEQLILEVPTQRDECCHAGGSIEFDSNGLLYLSTGDDTNPFAAYGGYAPIDERDGRKPWDAQRTSGNANDLRGAILRIKVEEDGTYSIPDGNLFPPGTEGTRPEIYVMGNRNPYRISLDEKTGALYWGEVGPDANLDSAGFGPKGHDEVNQAKQAGFYGWPYFVANNKAYWHVNYATDNPDFQFDPTSPVNRSPNNTGIQDLPPAQPAFIWYPYSNSREFPMLGSGGRNAMAGPVYYSSSYTAENKFPDYFNRKLFIYDWIRGWVHIVTLDEEERYVKMDRFMPGHKFSNPIDMQFAKDGSLYVLEYGNSWYTQNEDARLLRIDYNGGNRTPVVMAGLDRKAGAAPHRVVFNSYGTTDFDGDDLSYEWNFDGTATSNDPNPEFEFATPGMYYPSLTVTDSKGNSASRKLEVLVGNDPPQLKIELTGNESFYWDNQEIEYVVSVTDLEDGSIGAGINPSDMIITSHYLQAGYDETEIAKGHQEPGKFLTGRDLINGSDCMACHQIDKASVGPSYTKVAERYREDNNAVDYLAQKIIDGGSGVWGDRAMAAHPQISTEEAEEIVKYILSIGSLEVELLPTNGTVIADQHLKDNPKGKYYIKATYNDKGSGEIPSVPSSETLILNYHQLSAAEASRLEKSELMSYQGFEFVLVEDGGIIAFENIDLTTIGSINLNGAVPENGVSVIIEIDGSSVSEGEFTSTGVPLPQGQMYIGQGRFDLPASTGKGDLIIKFNTEGQRCTIFTVNFNKAEGI